MEFKAIENRISKIINEVDAFVESIEFAEVISEFKPKYFKEDILSNLENKKGVYFLEVKKEVDIPFKKWVNQLKNNWKEENKKMKSVPQVYNKRVKKLIKKEVEWLPFYIGKSKTVANRISKHILLLEKQSTYALKLKVRKHFQNATFKIHFIELDVNEDTYNFIAPEIEKRLREKYNPLVGKQ